METVPTIVLAACWIVWAAGFVGAPYVQKRPSITVTGPTRVGLALEAVGVVSAVLFGAAEPGTARVVAAAILGAAAAILSRTAVRHLGRQFRVHAGLFEDHQLVRSGPYAIVRHPIYLSVLCMLLATMLIRTPWQWMPVSLLLFLAGTEIRVRSEEALLESRFGEEFRKYRARVSAYIPFVR
jgi:protein-S-isoprenylcysteine O-methyltransferase Ste14